MVIARCVSLIKSCIVMGGALLLLLPIRGSADDQVKKTVDALRALCLAGEKYDLQIEGQLGLLLLQKGANGKVRFTETNARGVVEGIEGSNQLQELENIRNCISPHIPTILRMIRNEPDPPPRSDLSIGDVLRMTLNDDVKKSERLFAIRVSKVDGDEFVGWAGKADDGWSVEGTLAAGVLNFTMIPVHNRTRWLAHTKKCQGSAAVSGSYFQGKCGISGGDKQPFNVQLVREDRSSK